MIKAKKSAFSFLAVCFCLGLVSCGGSASSLKSSVLASSASSTVSVEEFSVTFDCNYQGAPTPTAVKVAKDGKVAAPSAPVRAGYEFICWCTDAEGTAEYSFNTPVISSFTLYASWLDTSVKTYTVTFNYNYEGAPAASTQKVQEGTKAVKPADPTRNGYVFLNWYTDAACTSKYSFNRTVSADLTLYAYWTHNYVFEAEYTNLEDLVGNGFSGTATGTNMILHDNSGNAKASNGYYVSYLYVDGISLEFDLVSDAAVSDAKIILRLSAEVKDITITSATYQIQVNNDILGYNDIAFTNVPTGGFSSDIKPFADYTIATDVSLAKGTNKVLLTTTNNVAMAGTMSATAPMVDCLKIQTQANLSWTPLTDNIR